MEHQLNHASQLINSDLFEINPISIRLGVCSHQAKAGAKAKAMTEQEKRSKNKRQTSWKMFTFASDFTQCEWASRVIFLVINK